MYQEQSLVLSQEQIGPAIYILWLAASRVAKGAQPGQFLMLRCGYSLDPLLPRPMSYHRFRTASEGQEFAILYRKVGRSTTWLSGLHPGDTLEVFGPLGRGFSLRPDARNLLMVAGGVGISGLVALADAAVAQGRSVTVLHGARTAAELYPPRLLPPEVELIAATDDASAGYPGLVTDLLSQYLPWADQVFACGPKPMFQSMANIMRQQASRKSVQILVEERMGCGTGICYGCAVTTRRGVRLACKDGPRFELRELF